MQIVSGYEELLSGCLSVSRQGHELGSSSPVLSMRLFAKLVLLSHLPRCAGTVSMPVTSQRRPEPRRVMHGDAHRLQYHAVQRSLQWLAALWQHVHTPGSNRACRSLALGPGRG